MVNLKRWRKEIELSRVRKENEIRGNLVLVYFLGILLFAVGAFLCIVDALVLMFFPSILSLIGLQMSGIIFILGVGLITLSIAFKNNFVRKTPLR